MTPSPPPRRYHSLDFWRGVACLLVVLGHSADTFMATTNHATDPVVSIASIADLVMYVLSAFARRAHWGVPMFFVISGYCITASAIKQRDRNLPVRDYFRRRLRRIFPPLWIFLAVALPLISLLELTYPAATGGAYWPKPWDATNWQWAGSLTLTESWRYHVIGDPTRHYLISHLWTLCYEEQFYLVVGIVLYFTPGRLFLAFALITVAVRLCSLFLPHESIHGFFFDGNWIAFAGGIAVFYAVHYASLASRIAICAALLAISLVQASGVAFGFAAMLIVLHKWDAKLHAARWAYPVSLCGVMCYSMYLTHQPLVIVVSRLCLQAGASGPISTAFLTLPICLATALMVAVVFHRYVERRFMNPAVPPVQEIHMVEENVPSGSVEKAMIAES